MEVYWVRHTKVAVNKGICYGQQDVPLAASFKEELQTIQAKLPKEAHCLSSPLLRCALLANELYPNPTAVDQRLLEYNFGDWEGKAWDEIPSKPLRLWMENFVTQRPPNGETYLELKERVVSFVEEIRISTSPQPLVISTHAGVIRSVLSHLLSIPLEQTFKLKLDYGAVVRTDLNKNKGLDSVCFV